MALLNLSLGFFQVMNTVNVKGRWALTPIRGISRQINVCKENSLLGTQIFII